MQGHLDSVLTSVGRNQARFAVPALARFEPELVLTSDLRRAADTAAIFTDATGIPLRLDKRLRETQLGKWQGLTRGEVEEGWPGAFDQWRSDPQFAPPGGESRLEVAARAFDVVNDLWPSDVESDSTIMLATHSGLISALTGRLLGLPPESWQSFRGLGNCHWAELVQQNDLWRLHAYNAGITS